MLNGLNWDTTRGAVESLNRAVKLASRPRIFFVPFFLGGQTSLKSAWLTDSSHCQDLFMLTKFFALLFLTVCFAIGADEAPKAEMP